MEGFASPMRRLAFSGLNPMRTFSFCQAVTLGDAMDGCVSDPKKISMKFFVNWGPFWAQQLERVLVDSDEDNRHSANFAGEVLEQCYARRAFDGARHVHTAGTSTVSMFLGEV